MFKVVSETPSILPYDSVQTRIDLPLTRQEAILHLILKSSLLNKQLSHVRFPNMVDAEDMVDKRESCGRTGASHTCVE